MMKLILKLSNMLARAEESYLKLPHNSTDKEKVYYTTCNLILNEFFFNNLVIYNDGDFDIFYCYNFKNNLGHLAQQGRKFKTKTE